MEEELKALLRRLSQSSMHPPLFEPILNGDTDQVKKLLEEGEDKDKKWAVRGHTPLTLAAERNNVDIVTVLLRYGADVSITYDEGWSPLMISAFRGNCEIASVLMANKANVEQRLEKTGATALILAVEQNQLKMVELLLEKGGANVNVTNDDGLSPLMKSAFEGNCEIASVLMAHKANVEQRSEKTGHTALIIAVEENHHDFVAHLLQEER